MRAAGKIHFSPRFKIFIVLHRMKRGQGGRGKSGFLHARVSGCTRSKGGERERERAGNAVELPSKSETRIISFSTNNNERGSSRQSGVLCYAPVFNYTSPKTPSALLRHTSPPSSFLDRERYVPVSGNRPPSDRIGGKRIIDDTAVETDPCGALNRGRGSNLVSGRTARDNQRLDHIYIYI